MTSPGLRERKKQATRAAISEAAWMLAAEHGVSAVTVEDIARRADISPRTFFNYFPGKEEAVLENTRILGTDIAAAIRARPRDEPLDITLSHAVRVVLDRVQGLPGDWLNKLRELRNKSPEIAPHQMAVFESITNVIATAIGEHTGTDPTRDLYPRLVTGWVLMAWRVAFDHWREDPGGEDLSMCMERAIAQLSVGIMHRID